MIINDDVLTVCIDFKSPHAYLALKPTLALSKELAIEIQWLPFSGPAHKHLEFSSAHVITEKEDRGTRHRHMRQQYRQQDLLRYAGKHGPSEQSLNREINSEPAAMALLWCRLHNVKEIEKYVQFIFQACWEQEENIADIEVIKTALVQAKAPLDNFTVYYNKADTTQLSALQEQLVDLGVFDTPFYLLKNDRYLGRQHLPMIKWQLNNTQGKKPI